MSLSSDKDDDMNGKPDTFNDEDTEPSEGKDTLTVDSVES